MAEPARAGTRLIAFRAFGIKAGQLTPIYKTGEWPLGVRCRAQCFCASPYGAGHHQMFGKKPEGALHARSPEENEGECGFYAYDRMQTLEVYLKTQGNNRRELMVGVVLLSGRIKVGKVRDSEGQLKIPGYRLRAEFGRVVALDKDQAAAFPLTNGDRVEWISRRYLEAWAADAFSGVRYGGLDGG